MFDNNVFKEATCKNIEEKGEVIGFGLRIIVVSLFPWWNLSK